MPPIRFLAATAALCAILPIVSYSQAAQLNPAPGTFEAVDIHPSPHRLHPDVRADMNHGNRFYVRDATMADLISEAYAVDLTSVFGGPPWLAFDRFDIIAKAPAGTTTEGATQMLRPLLSERFKLVAHPGTRSLPAFVLSAGKSPRLKRAEAAADPGECKYQQPAKGAPPSINIHFSCHNTTMEAFADFLHEAGSPYLTHPVVDATNLKGGWDFDFQWTYQMPKGGDGTTIFDAVDKQLGLKLEPRAAPLPVVVVESVNKEPTPNAPDIATILPPAPPAQFDVAVIHVANPLEKNFGMDIEGGNIQIRYATLQTLIVTAYDIGAGRMMNKPPWLNQVHYDIVGKASADAAPSMPGAVVPDFDLDEVKEMLRSLLADRFKLKTHMETQLADVFALVAAGPRMKKADPTNHPSCKEGPGPDGKDPRLQNPFLNRLISCQNMTMAELAGQLRNLAGGYVPAPVIDATGLDGAYDFTLSFSKKGDEARTASPPPAGDGGSLAASEPMMGGVSLFDALQKQLGLKLEKREKVPVPALVIDHVEEKPSEN